METTLLIKLKKDTKEEASKIASEIGIPLSTLINSFLKNFIREKKVTFSAEPEISKKKLKEWARISKEYKKHPERFKTAHSAEELIKGLLE